MENNPVGGAAAADNRRRGPQSARSISPSFIRFYNRTLRWVDLIWLNYEGLGVKYRTLGPNQFLDVNTFVGHPWIFRDKESGDKLVAQFQEVFEPKGWDSQEGPPRRRIVNVTIPVYSLRERCVQVIKSLVPEQAISKLEIPQSLQQELLEACADYDISMASFHHHAGVTRPQLHAHHGNQNHGNQLAMSAQGGAASGMSQPRYGVPGTGSHGNPGSSPQCQNQQQSGQSSHEIVSSRVHPYFVRSTLRPQFGRSNQLARMLAFQSSSESVECRNSSEVSHEETNGGSGHDNDDTYTTARKEIDTASMTSLSSLLVTGHESEEDTSMAESVDIGSNRESTSLSGTSTPDSEAEFSLTASVCTNTSGQSDSERLNLSEVNTHSSHSDLSISNESSQSCDDIVKGHSQSEEEKENRNIPADD